MCYLIHGVCIYRRVSSSDDLPEGAAISADVDGWSIVVTRLDGLPRAVINRCSHAAAAFLPDGRIRRGVMMCPAHGARFAVTDGKCVGGAYRALRTFPCREMDGAIEIEVPDLAPSEDERPVRR